MKPRKSCLWGVVVFFVLVKLAAAQDFTEVNIFGFVTDQATGSRLSGILVEAINEADTTQRVSTVSDATGKYVMNLVTDVPRLGDVLPTDFRLDQNYPNPFNPSTVIQFAVSQVSDVRLLIYNTLGQRVRTLVEETLAAGEYRTIWDATDDRGMGVAAGLYFYQLQTDHFAETKKMVLLDGAVSSLSSNLLPQRSETPLAKSGDPTLTIRATAARVLSFEQRNVVVDKQNFRFDIALLVLQASPLKPALIVVSEPRADGTVYVSGLADAVIDTVLRTEKVTARNQRTGEEVSMRVNLDGSFPLMTLDGIVGDSLSLTLSREGQQVGEEEPLLVPNSKPPIVSDTRPTNGDKDIILNAIIFIDFSEPIAPSTFNENSFTLTDNSGVVSGTIGFLNDNTVATFTPDEPLAPSTTYTFIVTTQVTDLQGLHLEDQFDATFTTGSGSIEGRIAFGLELETDCCPQIYVMNSDGSNEIRVTKPPPEADDLTPSWSPDGTRFIFERMWRKDGIYIVNSDGTFPEKLIDNLSPDNGWAADFSPDGTKIAFVSSRDGNFEIYVMNINGTDPVNLTNHPARDNVPSWSPDGSQIAFVSERDGGNDIFVMDRNGANPVNLTHSFQAAWNPAWSPDGTEIAFVTLSNEAWIMRSDGTNFRMLTFEVETFWYSPLSWSPDGSRIAFVTERLGSGRLNSGIGVINRDGSNRTLIKPISDAWYIAELDWSSGPMGR